MGKKLHPADIAARDAIASATDFCVFMYMHRARIMEGGFATMAAAAIRADELEKANQPKRALIYAMVGGVAVPVPAELRAAASAQPKGPKKMMETNQSIFSTVHKTQVAARQALKDLEDRPDFADLRIVPVGDQAGFRLCHKAALKQATAAKPVAAAAPAKKQDRHDADLEAAKAGKIPKEPDFSKPSRERYRAKLKAITALIRTKDVKGLKALNINPVDSANKIMCRYRDHAVIALQAKG